MRVFLRLGNAQLLLAEFCKVFAQRVVKRLLGEGDVHVPELRVVYGVADIHGVQKSRLSLECRALGNDERILRERTRDLARTVGAEVEEDDGVALADERDGLAVLHDVGGQDELIGDARLVGSVQRVRRILRMNAVADGQHVICLFDTVPVVVTVHRVISAADRRDLAVAELVYLRLQRFDEVYARGGGDVSAVHKAVDVRLGNTVLFRHFQQRVQVGNVTMDAAVRQKSPQVQLLAGLLGVLHRLQQGGIFKEVAVLDGLGDLGQILIDDAPRAHVEVSDFGVAHLPVGEPDGEPARAQRRRGIVFTVCRYVLAAVHGDGVALARRRKPVAVHDDDRAS